ncbi:MAG: hypothetical protein KYX68_09455 [Flavobacterium sp.]|nr:hypothetical protein [Flavobacterium sp.]
MRFIIFVASIIFFISCTPSKKNNLECCFKQIKIKIESRSDTILNSLKYSSINSYGNYSKIIHESVLENSKQNLDCSSAIDSFMIANKQNSITVNNLILFQQFQSYLKNEKFDFSNAYKKALKYEKKYGNK